MSTGDRQPRFISVLVGENTRIHSQLLAEAISHESGLRIIGAVSTAAEFLGIAARRKPDVAVVGAGLGDDPVFGLAALRQFHIEHPEVPTVALLDSSLREIVLEAFRCGARGVFSKNESLEHLPKCIRSVHLGQVWANSREVRFILEALSAAPSIRVVNAKGLDILSARELEVVQHLAEGLTNRAVGDRMQLSRHTIKNYVLRIFEKLGVSNRVELLRLTLSHPMSSQPATLSLEDLTSGPPPILWCQRAAERGAAHAQLLLAELYRDGDGVPRDLSTAYYWYCLCEKTNPEVFALARTEKEKLSASLSGDQVKLVHAKIARLAELPTRMKALKPPPGAIAVHGDRGETPTLANDRRAAFGI
jgi:two-component system, NarL family, nitrate/nitrite response regulator NarL